ncbi:MAG: hypothetical protein M0014_01935 [Actinomycetota bacterium]|nr:hypothetical protein [Actinomycetota bacterium]
MSEDVATLLAPMLLTSPVRGSDGELLEGLRRVTLALTSHPRRGPGVMVNVALLEGAVEAAAAYSNWYVATRSTPTGSVRGWGASDLGRMTAGAGWPTGRFCRWIRCILRAATPRWTWSSTPRWER